MGIHGIALLIVALQSFGQLQSHRLVDDYVQCRNQKIKNSLEACFKRLFQNATALMVTGVPEFGIKPYDPLYIDRLNLSMAQAEGLMNVNLIIFKTNARGMSKMVAKTIRTSPVPGQFSIDWQLPQLRLNGQYRVTGTAFGLEVTGSSTYFILYNRLTGIYEVKTRFNEKLKAAVVDWSKFRFDIEGGRSRVNNMMGGGELGETINDVMNQNFVAAAKEANPVICEKIVPYVDDLLNKIFKQLPAEYGKEIANYVTSQ